MSTTEAPLQTDDEWRAETFGEAAVISARISDATMGTASFTALLAAMRANGPDGVLESAILLPRSQYERLAEEAKRFRKNHQTGRWERKR